MSNNKSNSDQTNWWIAGPITAFCIFLWISAIVSLGIVGGFVGIPFFFIGGVIYLAINGIWQRVKEKNRYNALLRQAQLEKSEPYTEPCPACDEDIEEAWKVCPYCGACLDDDDLLDCPEQPEPPENPEQTKARREFMEQLKREEEEGLARMAEFDKCPICGAVMVVRHVSHADEEMEYRNHYEAYCKKCDKHMTRRTRNTRGSYSGGYDSGWEISKPDPPQEHKSDYDEIKPVSHIDVEKRVVSDTPYRILHIDHDPVILNFVRANLEAINFIVTTAEDSESGLKAVEETLPDLVIMEVMMPGMDGVEVCRRIREWSDIPIIILTGMNTDEARTTLLNFGANAVHCSLILS